MGICRILEFPAFKIVYFFPTMSLFLLKKEGSRAFRKAHKVIAEYDKRADVENLVGVSKREGLDAIPSSRFKNNYA